ncbi:hypothetical protein Avbf_17738 [Armadillidium vulgare]|nr:hypothetical protein Avbf_17738 [Armadillidium vulgare]
MSQRKKNEKVGIEGSNDNKNDKITITCMSIDIQNKTNKSISAIVYILDIFKVMISKFSRNTVCWLYIAIYERLIGLLKKIPLMMLTRICFRNDGAPP